MFWGYFGNFLCFGGVSVIFWVLGVFWTFFCLSRGILVIYQTYRGYFVLIQVIEGILASFRHKGYSGHFRCLRGCLGHFLCFEGISVIY